MRPENTMHATTKRPLLRPVTNGILLMSTLALANAAHAELEFNVGVFSDYLDDGASGSNNNAVVQGGVDYAHGSGLYLGTWMSTLSDGDGQEVNVYAGYAWEFGEWGLDLGYTYAWYPELDGEDNGEIGAQLLWGPVYVGLGWTTNADDSDLENDLTYTLGGELEVIPTVSVFGELGYYDPDSSSNDSLTFWSLGIGKATDYGDVSLTYGSTDESGSQDLFVVGYSIHF
jgi:uncharacterized protein (TIGR02001 family)